MNVVTYMHDGCHKTEWFYEFELSDLEEVESMLVGFRPGGKYGYRVQHRE